MEQSERISGTAFAQAKKRQIANMSLPILCAQILFESQMQNQTMC